MRRSILIAAVLIAALPAASSARRERLSDEAELTKALDGLTPGKPVSCIDLRDARGSESIGNSILFRASRSLSYRNDPRGGCRASAFAETLVTRTYGGQLCRGDLIRRVDLTSGFEGSACILSDFVPYRKNK
jgi:hypothetical protein